MCMRACVAAYVTPKRSNARRLPISCSSVLPFEMLPGAREVFYVSIYDAAISPGVTRKSAEGSRESFANVELSTSKRWCAAIELPDVVRNVYRVFWEEGSMERELFVVPVWRTSWDLIETQSDSSKNNCGFWLEGKYFGRAILGGNPIFPILFLVSILH